MITRPMLAATLKEIHLEDVNWPMLCSPKIDGIRCLMHPELGPVTRSFKALPNVHAREILAYLCRTVQLDGELVAIDMQGNPLPFNDTQSAMMSRGGQPLYEYHVFDSFRFPGDAFRLRYHRAYRSVDAIAHTAIKLIPHVLIESEEEFLIYTEETMALGYEGVMLRDPEGPYKSGRSTVKQGWLLKWKEWADAEGTVIGFEELMRNTNEDERDNFDLAKRSHAKSGMVKAGTLGALILDTKWGQLRIGSGMDAKLRQKVWDRNMVSPTGRLYREPGHWIQPDLGRTVTFKYQPHGMQDLPRFPIFLHFREDE